MINSLMSLPLQPLPRSSNHMENFRRSDRWIQQDRIESDGRAMSIAPPPPPKGCTYFQI
jgi:hypothetical protein